jgi:lysophospholipase L1-like esterase
MVKNLILLATFILVALATISSADTCKAPYNLTDINCDNELNLTVLGDSLVYGTGDEVNGGRGGYVLRASKKLNRVRINNLGQSGLRAKELLLRLSRNLVQPIDIETLTIIKSDVIFLDLGRNDRWLYNTPLATFRDLKRIATLISRRTEKLTGFKPLIVTSVLMLPNRGAQAPWVEELNKIIELNSSSKFPRDLRFDQVSKRLLNEDGIHPTSEGYEELTKVFTKYVRKQLRRRQKEYLVTSK